MPINGVIVYNVAI